MKIIPNNYEIDVLARCWIRYYADPKTNYILENRLPEPNYRKTLSIEGDVWCYDDNPHDVLCDYSIETPDIAYDIVLRISNITDDEWLLELLAAGPLEDLISHHDESEVYLAKYKILMQENLKLRHLFSMVWF